MKKLVIATICVFSFLYSEAQVYYEHALGVRAGTIISASYKRFVKNSHAVEGMFGLKLDEGISMGALYEYHLSIGYDTGFAAYGGGGFLFGASKNKKYAVGINAAAVLGIEYVFRLAPVAISLDYMPLLGTSSSYIGGALSARYTFNKVR